MRSKEQYLQQTTAEMKCSVAPTGLSVHSFENLSHC